LGACFIELGYKREEVTGGGRKLHNEELHDLYFSPNIWVTSSRSTKWAGHVAHMEERRSAYRILVGKPEEKTPLGRSARRMDDNIKMGVKEIEWDGTDWVHLAQLGKSSRLCEHGNEPSGSIKC
jgi:hypothetical protein